MISKSMKRSLIYYYTLAISLAFCLLSVEAQVCRTSSYPTCSSCSGSTGCYWCPSSSECMTLVGSCSVSKIGSPSNCPAAASCNYASCSACTAASGCGWCSTGSGSSGSCRAGASAGSTDGCSGSAWKWTQSSCSSSGDAGSGGSGYTASAWVGAYTSQGCSTSSCCCLSDPTISSSFEVSGTLRGACGSSSGSQFYIQLSTPTSDVVTLDYLGQTFRFTRNPSTGSIDAANLNDGQCSAVLSKWSSSGSRSGGSGSTSSSDSDSSSNTNIIIGVVVGVVGLLLLVAVAIFLVKRRKNAQGKEHTATARGPGQEMTAAAAVTA